MADPKLNAFLALNLSLDPDYARLLVEEVSADTQGSEESFYSVFSDAYNEATGKLRVVVVPGSPSSTYSDWSAQRIMQDVHDPGAHAIRIIKGEAVGGESGFLSLTEILQEVFDPDNHALRVSPAPG